MPNFDFSSTDRHHLLQGLIQNLEDIYANPEQLKITPSATPAEISAYARRYDFSRTNAPEEVLETILEGMKQFTVHTSHSSYFGLFNPRANFLSVLADYITAVFNPQLAGWSHAPYANEMERAVIEGFGRKFGYESPDLDGTFCSGGAESNLTGMVCALNQHFPEFGQHGIDRRQGQPRIYGSAESHHSLVKAARITGLGSEAIRTVPVLDDLTMDLSALRQMIREDQTAGDRPFMVVGTAGTTGAGAIDRLSDLADICSEHKLWLHIDAAYGGAIIVSREHRHLLDGIHRADSITLDVHKWFSVPMGASLFLTRNPTILHRSFGIKTNYMPADGDQVEAIDPYIHSIQWSRRLTGLKIYLPLAVFGWAGYEEGIEHQVRMGNRLRELLREAGCEIKNDTALPIVCFTPPRFSGDRQSILDLVDKIQGRGNVWVSSYPVRGQLTIRACITNYNTQEEDLERLLSEFQGLLSLQ